MKPLKIRNILLIPFSILILIFSAMMGLQSLINSQSYIENLLTEIMLDTHELITSEIEHRLSIHEQLNQANKIYLQQRNYKADYSGLNELMLNQLNSFKDIDAVYFSSEENWFSGYARFGQQIVHMYSNEDTGYSVHYDRFIDEQNDTQLLQIIPEYIATQKAWYKEASDNPLKGWGSTFSYDVLPTLALPNSLVITNLNGQRIGVVGNDLFLDNMGDVLKGFFNIHNGNSFIIDSSGALIGSSTHYRPYIIRDGKINQIDANDSQDQLILKGMEIHKSLDNDNPQMPYFDSIEANNHSYRLGIFKFNHEESIDWTLFIYLEEQGILDQANQSFYNSLGTIIGGMLLTMLLSAYLAQRISTPIRELSEKVSKWKDNPTAQPDIKFNNTPIDEIQQLAESTYQMQNRITNVMQELRKKITENQHFINEIEKLAMVAENTDDMVLICDANQQIEWANESFLNKYGLKPGEVFFKNAFDLLTSPEAQDNELKDLEAQLTAAGSVSVQQIHYDHSGSPHWVQLNIHQIKNKEDEVQHHIHIIQDITAQKNFEQELTKWKTVFYAADWGISISEGDNMMISLANPAFAKLHGYELNELVNMNSKSFYPIDVYTTIRSYVDVAKDTGSVTFETEHIDKNNNRFPVLQNISIFHDQQGDIGGLITSVQDVSEIKSLQSQLMQSQKMEAMGTLAGGMAHDFNNILASIMGNAELSTLYVENIEELVEHENLSDLNERLAAIVKSCNRASDLTNKILSYSRMDSPDFENLSLEEVVEESVSMVKPMLPATINIELTIDVQTDTILGNESQLQQVFMNLLTNAFHAIQTAERKAGVVAIEMKNVLAEDGSQQIQLVFSDNGCGIPQKALAHVFDPFFTTKEKGKGTGLGLSVVTGILRAHGVNIDVESRLNVGTEFTLSFPTSNSMKFNKNQIGGNSIDTSISKPSHIVLVDDEKTITEVWGKILRKKGFEVTAFNRPEHALEFIIKNGNSVDLVISDYDMKVMTGAELCAQLHRDLPELPLVMLTGYSEKMDESRAREIGIVRLLLKPISLSAILAAITQSLNAK